jgi:hypothetical protein
MRWALGITRHEAIHAHPRQSVATHFRLFGRRPLRRTPAVMLISPAGEPALRLPLRSSLSPLRSAVC